MSWLWVVLLILLASICTISLYVFFTKVDCDLTLYLYDYFGNASQILSGKVIWITGASSGIGEYLAYELASYGTRLVLSGTNQKRLEKVKALCQEKGLSENDVLVLPFNICDFDLHEHCVKTVLEKFHKVDILVNNAGRSQRANFQDIDIEVDKHMFDVNVFGTLSLTRKVLTRFLKRGVGHVVVTSSCAGKIGLSFSASYTASKHALHGYFESLRTEMGQKNISVTLVCPGPVFSNFLENALTDKPGEKLGAKPDPKDKRMPTDRCSHLMAVAIAYKLDEVWITMQPSLTLLYLAQYTPTFFRRVIIGILYSPERAAKLREGRW